MLEWKSSMESAPMCPVCHVCLVWCCVVLRGGPPASAGPPSARTLCGSDSAASSWATSGWPGRLGRKGGGRFRPRPVPWDVSGGELTVERAVSGTRKQEKCEIFGDVSIAFYMDLQEYIL